MAKRDAAIRGMQQLLKTQEESGKNPNRTIGEPHALLLDISRGKPLWDVPRAKIIRVDDSGRKIFIDKGAADGVKPGLTFNAFAAGKDGRAGDALKATVEVVRVEDARMSLCKVNTYYDVDGREFPAPEATPTRLFQEGGGALKEGDLLFNMCWGAHAAIAGTIDPSGANNTNPAVQMDNLKQFISYLERMGMVIDAYVDPRDGKLVGDVNGKTNFLIRGNRATVLQEGVDEKRAKAVNDNITALRDKAIDGGMFMISAENMAIVTGYRRPGSADTQQTLTFVPRPPAGAPIQPDATQPPPDTQKKDK
jgi:hypothetical protein